MSPLWKLPGLFNRSSRLAAAGILLALGVGLHLLAGGALALGPVNVGLLERRDNADADLELRDIPRNLTALSDEVTIRWTPAVRGRLRFGPAYAGETPGNYRDTLTSVVRSSEGLLTFRGSALPVGYHYCIIDAGRDGYSVVFNIIRIADQSPRMVNPISAEGRAGINTVSPVFRWDAVGGVPFYHVIVSDQRFEIEPTEDGGTRVQGANIIWQAITAGTSIQFGIPDPSEFFDNANTPPLVGSRNRDDRPRYAWVVLNNYGNNPSYTSTVTGGVAGFEVEVDPPFDRPQNISPANDSQTNAREIVFRWTQVPEAASYFVYVSREETTPGGSQALVPAWSGQTTLTSIAVPAIEVLPAGLYKWKVLAASRQGRGTLSPLSAFRYITASGEVTVRTRTSDGAALEQVEISVESIEGPSIPDFSTDDGGEQTRDIAVGRYRFHAIKSGYREAVSNEVRVAEGEERAVTLSLAPLGATIVGTVVNDSGFAVSGAEVHAAGIAHEGSGTAETNVAGQYQLILEPGAYFVRASARGHHPSDETAVDVESGVNYDFDDRHGRIQLARYRYTISGYVRNPAGQPINLATVLLTSEAGAVTRAFTPEGGTYQFTVGPGVWRLNGVKPGFYLEAGEQAVTVRESNVDLNFTLVPQAGILSGQLLIDGTPANRLGEIWMIPTAGEVIIVPAGAQGAFNRGVPPGDYMVTAVRNGWSAQDSLAISVEPGETISGLRLRLAANPSSISGRVTDAGGAALQNASVAAGGVTLQTDANGNYRLQVASGNHQVRATRNGFVSAVRGPISVEPGQSVSGINLSLANNAGTISGQVRRGNDPIYDALVTAVRQEDNSRYTARTDRQGRYSFGLIYGAYLLTVERDGFIASGEGRIEVALQPGQEVADRNFAMLNYSARVIGTISSAAGPVNTPQIQMIQLDDQNRVLTTNGNVQGAYSLTVTPDRRYIVIASKTGYSTGRDTTARLNPEGEITINIRLTPLPSQVGGNVTSGNVALASAVIQAIGDAGTFRTESDRSGRYQLALQPGQYQITAAKAGYTVGEANLRIQAGEDRTGVNFALEENFASASGVVRSTAGTPISGVEITLLDSTAGRSRFATTDGDGTFNISGIIPGNYVLRASHQRFAGGIINVGAILGRQVRRGLDLQLEPLASRLTGSVTAAGAPVAGATVFASLANGRQVSALSGNDGRYALENLSGGRLSLRPARAGYSSSALDTAIAAAETLRVDLQMIRNDGRITGIVRDIDNAGLRGVAVAAIDSLGNFAQTQTDAAGNFTLDNLYPRTAYRVAARLANYTANPDTVRGVAIGTQMTIRLQPNELRLSGRVVNQVGQGIAETELLVTSLADGSTYRATANAQGNFTVVGLAPNTRYRVQTQRIEEHFANGDTSITIGANHLDVGGTIIVIQRTAALAGSIGIPDVTVESRNLLTGRMVTGYTAQNGTFRLLRLRGGDGGNFVVRARRPGYVVRGGDSLAIRGVGLTEERSGVDFTLDRILVTISGRVVDSDGSAMGSVPVFAWSDAGQFGDTTGDDGNYRIEGLFPNLLYTLATRLPVDGYTNAFEAVAVDTSAIAGRSLVVVRHNAAINGTVRNVSNQLLQNVRVTLDAGDTASTNRDGEFHFTFVRGGDHTLRLERDGYIRLDTTINTGIGDRAEPYQVDYTLTALERAIYGRITRSGDNVALVSCRVRLVSNRGDTLNALTSSNGNYQFNRLDPEKTYSVQVTKRGYQTYSRADLTVRSGSVAVNRALSRVASSLAGVLTDTDNNPVPRGVVILRSFANVVRTDTSDEFGDYQLPVEAGNYMVLGIDPRSGKTSYNTNLAVNLGQSPLLNLRIADAGVLVGRLEVEGGGPPVSSGMILASNNSTGDQVFNWSNADGTFRLRGLRSGGTTVSVQAAGYAMETGPAQVDIALRDTTRIVIRLTRHGKALVGYVLDQDENPVSRARVTIRGATNGDIITTEEGYFNLDSPDAGRCTISLGRNGFVAPPDTVFDLPPGELMSLTLRMERIPNAVSGAVRDDDGIPLEAISVELKNNANVRVGRTTTDRFGEYIFDSLAAGSYRVIPTAGSYRPVPTEKRVELAAGTSYLDIDFLFAPIRGFGRVNGTVTHSGSPESGAVVYLQNLTTGERTTLTTAANGNFAFTSVAAPGTYRLRATIEGLSEVISDTFHLAIDSTIARSLALPTGRIRTRLIDAESLPVLGRRVWVSGLDYNYTTQLISDASGYAATPDYLVPGRYSVVVQPLTGALPPAPREVSLGLNQRLEIEWRLGWRLTPPPPFSFEDSGRVQIDIPDAVQVLQADLYWRNVGAFEFASKPLVRQAGGGMPPRGGRGFRSAEGQSGLPTDQQASAISNLILPPTYEQAPDGSELYGSDASVAYYAYIPAQSRSGTLAYYLQVETRDGLIFGGPESMLEVTITAVGLLDHIELSRTQSALPPQVRVPVRLTVKPLDNSGQNITDRILRAGQIRFDQLGDRLGELTPDPQDPTSVVYTPLDQGRARIGVTVVQQLNQGEVTLRDTSTFAWLNGDRPVVSITLGADVKENILSGGAVRLFGNAIDSSGMLLPMLPSWRVEPDVIGTLTPRPYSLDATYQTLPGRIGQVNITVADSMNPAVRAGFNDDSPDRSRRGLAVYGRIEGGRSDTIRFEDGAGFSVALPPNVLPAGQATELYFSRPILPPVMRLSPKFESAPVGYRLTTSSGRIPSTRSVFTLPVPSGFVHPTPQVGIWSDTRIEWDVVTDAEWNADRTAVVIRREKIEGLYTLLNDSPPLGVHDLKFRPNPFSPEASSGCAVEFTLTSDLAEAPIVTVRIYNMAGELVRRLRESTPIPKGFISRGSQGEIIWDGRTDSGREARNGRYVVVVIAKDPSGEVKKVGSAVLVK